MCASIPITVITFVVMFLVICRPLTQADKKSGLYSVSVLSIGECEESGTNEMIMHTRIRKTSRKDICYSGWLHMPYGINDNMQELWEISSQGSTGGWKRLLSFRNRHACSDTKRLFPRWFDVMKASNKSDGSCPIPKGNYTFGCLDLSNLQFERAKEMIYGTYKATIKYYYNKTNIGCALYMASVNPRLNYSESSFGQ